MFTSSYLIPLLAAPLVSAATSGSTTSVDLGWYSPNSTWINSLPAIINGTGTNGFVFSGSELPKGVAYGTYNWCNMPHVRKDIYAVVNKEYTLEYVELIHRHHKRTPYAANTFPKESYAWYCSDQGLFYYGEPINPDGREAADTYWSVFTSESNPFAPTGFNGSCQFPQITREGLDDSWQHGKDLYEVYHDLLHFLPSNAKDKVSFRVTNNVITSQVGGMVVQGLGQNKDSKPYPLSIQPSSIDSLEPAYTCSAASSLYSSYGVGGTNANWTAHLTASASLFSTLDGISGVSTTDSGWHRSWDHYYDNLSARQCHAKPLPCKIGNSAQCVNQELANSVYRLGQYEYSYIYRDAPQSLQASTASYGVWVAELAQNLRNRISGVSDVIYRHNVAHDGSVSRLLSILQVDVMVWPGMGSEVVFELYSKRGEKAKHYVRVLFGGQVLRSSNPSLGKLDMLDVDVLLAYFDGLVGIAASKVPGLCTSG